MFKLMLLSFWMALKWHLRGLPPMGFQALGMLPTKNNEKLTVLRAAADKITATPTDYGLDAGAATALDAKVTAAENAAADAATYQTLKESKVNAAQTALDEAEALFREDANIARFTPAVTDEKLADIGLSRRTPPSRVGAPSEAPELSVETLGIGFVNLKMVQPSTRGASLPDDADGYEVSLVDGTVASADGEADMGVKTFVTKSRSRVATDIGKARLRVYSRYVGKRGQFGPWSLPVQFSPPQP